MIPFTQAVRGLLMLLMLGSGCHTFSQTLWTGPTMTFSKPDSVDWTLTQYHDSISPSVVITRATNQGIFNINLESGYDRTDRDSPAGTKWANGSISDGIANLTFTSWFESLSDGAPDDVGRPKVVHLIAEDIYLDLMFTEWTPGGGGSGTGFGGGFTYRRSTDPATDLRFPASTPNDVNIWLHPYQRVLFVSPVSAQTPFSIMNTSGAVVHQGYCAVEGKVALPPLSAGIYFLQLQAVRPIVKRFLIR